MFALIVAAALAQPQTKVVNPVPSHLGTQARKAVVPRPVGSPARNPTIAKRKARKHAIAVERAINAERDEYDARVEAAQRERLARAAMEHQYRMAPLQLQAQRNAIAADFNRIYENSAAGRPVIVRGTPIPPQTNPMWWLYP